MTEISNISKHRIRMPYAVFFNPVVHLRVPS